MNARLVIIDPERIAPSYPVAIVDNGAGIVLCGDDWVSPLPLPCLEDVTESDVRSAMNLPSTLPLLLSSVRALPEHAWMSVEMLSEMESWRDEVVAQWQGDRWLQRAS